MKLPGELIIVKCLKYGKDKGNYVPEPNLRDLQLFINKPLNLSVVYDTEAVRF